MSKSFHTFTRLISVVFGVSWDFLWPLVRHEGENPPLTNIRTLRVICALFHCNCISLHLIEFYCFHWVSLHLMAFHGISLHLVGFYCVSLSFIASHGISWHFIASRCVSLHLIAYLCVHGISLHFIASHCISLRFIAFYVCFHVLWQTVLGTEMLGQDSGAQVIAVSGADSAQGFRTKKYRELCKMKSRKSP